MIGSGAGGSAAAHVLATAGVDTLLLEAGPAHDPASFTQREGDMLGRLYLGSGLITSLDSGMPILAGRGLGGSTIHNTGLCVPPPVAVLERWAAEGRLPASAHEVGEEALSVLRFLRARPVHPSEHNRNNRVLSDGARVLGWSHAVPLHNRSECSGCGFCILGCAYNRKHHAGFAFLEPAAAAGLAVWTGAEAKDLEPRGDSVAVRGPGFEVLADRVVVAASALRSPLLLERCGLVPSRRPSTLRLHPFAPVAAEFQEPVLAWEGVPQTVLVDQFSRSGTGEEGGFVLMAAAAGPAATAAVWPDLEVRRGMGAFPRHAFAGVLLHDRSGGSVRRGWGDGPRVRYWPQEADQADLWEGIRRLAELYFAAGAARVRLPFSDAPALTGVDGLAAAHPPPFVTHRTLLSSVHPQGSLPFGRNGGERGDALDRFGRCVREPRVMVADASVFPGSIGVPPQVTIMALARIQAAALVAELRS